MMKRVAVDQQQPVGIHQDRTMALYLVSFYFKLETLTFYYEYWEKITLSIASQ